MNETAERSSFWIPAALFTAAFALYLFSSPPALAPYRDMGEMVSVSATLGVAHPPGYPLYSLLGRAAVLLAPFATASYRLALLAAAGAALSGLFLYLLLLQLGFSVPAALLSAAFWLTSGGVWTVALVTEMYSLQLAAAFGLLYVWARGKDSPDVRTMCGAAFLGGLALGVRLEFVLLLPGFGIAAWWSLRGRKERMSVLGTAFLFFLAGFSAYLYLPVRSAHHPLLNWERPDTVKKLWDSLTRKSHGGTLDLLSLNYAPGQLFWTDFRYYLADFGRQFYWVGFPLALLGLRELFRRDRILAWITVAGWALAGPFFLYEANLPPNPHALAILEVHFLLPDVLCMVWIAFGLSSLEASLGGESARKIPSLVLVVLLAAGSAVWRWGDCSKRRNFFGVDYARNIFASLPPDSILIMQKDVQLFLFWAMQYAEHRRPDVVVVARGLAGSPWYIRMQEDAGRPVLLGPLRTEEDFARFLSDNPGRRIFAGWEEDVPPSERYRQTPHGLVRELSLGAMPPAPDFLRDFYVYRGLYRADRQKEFFSSDLVDDYSKAYFALASDDSKQPAAFAAREKWDRAIALNPENAAAYERRALLSFQQNRYEEAVADFRRADAFYQKTAGLTRVYYSLPDVVNGIRGEWADTLLNLGVALERLNKRDEAEAAYLKALEVQPDLPQAHYNIAVLYWNRDWEKVVGHLEAALRIDPNYAQAAAFLPKARYALAHSRPGGAP